MKRLALYAGSFDPITKGHLDIIERAAALFDHLVVGVGINVEKPGLFTSKERMQMIKEATRGLEHVEIITFTGLAVEAAQEHKCVFLVRGLRDGLDFSYEMKVAQMNRHLAPKIETLFIPTSDGLSNVSSSLVKEVAKFGGDVSKFLPKNVAKELEKKFRK